MERGRRFVYCVRVECIGPLASGDARNGTERTHTVLNGDGLNATESDSWLGMQVNSQPSHTHAKMLRRCVLLPAHHASSFHWHNYNKQFHPPSRRAITSRHAERSCHREVPQTKHRLFDVLTWERENRKNIIYSCRKGNRNAICDTRRFYSLNVVHLSIPLILCRARREKFTWTL